MSGLKALVLFAFVAMGFIYESNAMSLSFSPVKVGIYYETMCPACKQFIGQQIYPAYKELSDIMELEIVPYGNVKVIDGVRHCQHGEIECFGNTVQSCALHQLEFKQALDFIACMENNHKLPTTSAPQCAKENNIDYQPIFDCAIGQEGKDLTDEMAKKTVKHDYVPWITINGVHTEDLEDKALENLKKVVCDTYKGVKPQACH